MAFTITAAVAKLCVVFVVHKEGLPALPLPGGNPIPALHLTIAMRRWKHAKDFDSKMYKC